MVNYQLGKIYKISSDQTNLVYYGSTCELLSKRMGKHRASYKMWLVNQTLKYTTSFRILEFGDAQIVLIKLFPCNSKEELHKMERGYIENNSCVNKNIPNRTIREYRIENREQIIEQKKEYYQINSKQIHAKANVKFVCDVCSGCFTNSNKMRHSKSIKHQRSLSI